MRSAGKLISAGCRRLYQFAFKTQVIEKSGEVTASSQKDRTPNYKRRTPVCTLNANPIVVRVPRTPQDLAARGRAVDEVDRVDEVDVRQGHAQTRGGRRGSAILK